MQNPTPRPPGYGLLYAAMAFGVVAFAVSIFDLFSLGTRLWIVLGGDVLMVATLVAWVIVSRRTARG